MNRIAPTPLVGRGGGNTIATGKHAGAFRTGSDLSANRRGAAGLFVSVDLRISATLLGWPFNFSFRLRMTSRALNSR